MDEVIWVVGEIIGFDLVSDMKVDILTNMDSTMNDSSPPLRFTSHLQKLFIKYSIVRLNCR